MLSVRSRRALFLASERCGHTYGELAAHDFTFHRIIQAVGLRAEGKDIWWKCGGGIFGETEGGEARFEGFGGEMGDGWKGRKRGVTRALGMYRVAGA